MFLARCSVLRLFVNWMLVTYIYLPFRGHEALVKTIMTLFANNYQIRGCLLLDPFHLKITLSSIRRKWLLYYFQKNIGVCREECLYSDGAVVREKLCRRRNLVKFIVLNFMQSEISHVDYVIDFFPIISKEPSDMLIAM